MLSIAMALAWSSLPTTTNLGIGKQMCAVAIQPRHLSETRAWVLGFWSGLNENADRSASGARGEKAIIEEVRDECAKRQALSLEVVAQGVHMRHEHMRQTPAGGIVK